MVYGLDKTSIGLDKTAIGLGVIKRSTGDKMVYGPPWLDKIVFGLDKTAIGGDEIFYGR